MELLALVCTAALFHSGAAVMTNAFDLWWQWTEKPLDSDLTIPAEIHNPVIALSDEDRRGRAKVNDAVRKYRESGE
jgi:hypothetical protein